MMDSKQQALNAQQVRANSLGWMLKTITAQMDRDMTDLLKQLNLSLGQFAVLMTLLECDGLSQSDICQKVTMPGYAMTRNISALEAMGLVIRDSRTDSRRGYAIRLTERARALAPQLFAIVQQVNAHHTQQLSTEERSLLLTLLGKMI